ncbi:MAG: hypothetical protein HY735_27695 [Verrucomicrobia bacterium]|nr:hypothetical protein [Verrucomicrobiota bacterium]
MPTREDVRKLKALFKREADEDFFFNNLKSAAWLQPLADEGYFGLPPAPIVEGEYVRFPAWAQSRCLARLANQAPVLAVAIAATVPQTDNPQVMHDLIEVALAAPPAEGAKLRQKIATVGRYRTNYEDLRRYAMHLANGGLALDALKVLAPFIGFMPDPRLEEKRERRRQQALGSDLEAATRMPEWDFQKIVKDVVPRLVEADGLLTIRFLCDELDRGIRHSRWEDDDENMHDGSVYWRPSVSDHRQNRLPSPRSHYVAAIRDACEVTLRKRLEAFQEVDAILAAKPWDIFARLRIHLATLFPDAAGEARLREIAMNREFFSGPWWTREYTVFTHEHFRRLAPEVQNTVLGWVDQGPDEKTLDRLKRRSDDTPFDEDVVRKRIASWHVRHLQGFKANLPAEWTKRYETWLAAGGVEDPHLGFVIWVGEAENAHGIGTSPISKEDIDRMGIEGLIAFLKAWEPPKSFLGPERSTVGSVMEKHIKEAPAAYADTANNFAELSPEYVAVVIRTLAEAFAQKTISNVEPVLRLLSWVTAVHGRGREAPDVDDGWDYTRLETARFLEKILPLRPVLMAPEYRGRIWSILSVLARDPNPSAENERLHEQTDFDAYTASLNRTRGTALHAVFRYAGWVKSFSVHNGHGFRVDTELPEVVELLLERSDPKRETTRMVCAVFGQAFPILHELDTEFAAELKPIIFPAGGAIERWELAWTTYVVSWTVGADMLRALSDEYARAVEGLAEAKSTSRSHWDPQQALANHLTSFYWRGLVAWDSPLFQRFLLLVPSNVMTSTLEEIGRLLKNTDGTVSVDILGRLQRLWESRVDGWKQDKAKGVVEASAFPWWFSSGKFERQWATRQMLAALGYCGTTSVDYMVLETFAEQVSATPLEALQAIQIMAVSALETGRFFYTDKSARAILYAAGQSDSEKVRGEACGVRDRLLSLKYDSFRDVLERPPGDND